MIGGYLLTVQSKKLVFLGKVSKAECAAGLHTI